LIKIVVNAGNIAVGVGEKGGRDTGVLAGVEEKR
jgi:hypothetical protein